MEKRLEQELWKPVLQDVEFQWKPWIELVWDPLFLLCSYQFSFEKNNKLTIQVFF